MYNLRLYTNVTMCMRQLMCFDECDIDVEQELGRVVKLLDIVDMIMIGCSTDGDLSDTR